MQECRAATAPTFAPLGQEGQVWGSLSSNPMRSLPTGVCVATELVAKKENLGFTSWCQRRCAAFHHDCFHHRVFFRSRATEAGSASTLSMA